MAEITIERSGMLLRELFALLLEHPEGMRAKAAVTALASRVHLTPYEAGNYESGGRRFDKIIRFATVGLAKAGWLTKSVGVWTVTDAGKEALARFTTPEAFYREAARLYSAWKSAGLDGDAPIAGTVAIPDAEAAGGERTATITFEQAEEQASEEATVFLANRPPYEVQALAAELLRAMGYFVTWEAPKGKDGGIDIIAFRDPLGAQPPRIKVQVKRTAEAVAVEGLRSFLALIGDGDIGLFVSTGGFTRDAREEARRQESRQVTLVDAPEFYGLWARHYEKLSERAKRTFPLRPIWFLAPEE